MRPISILIAVLATLALTRAAAASPVGLWRAKDGGQIRIAACGKALFGFVATTHVRIDPETGRPPVDKHNPDPAKRSRPLAGMQILFGMAPSAPGESSGELYNDDDDGQTYHGRIRGARAAGNPHRGLRRRAVRRPEPDTPEIDTI